MNLLYSNILPLGTEEGQETVSNQLKEEIANSDAIEIAVGYVSKASLEELDRIVTEQQIHHVILTIGMYFVEGMPEAMYPAEHAPGRCGPWRTAPFSALRCWPHG